jgi:hypothetical protein
MGSRGDTTAGPLDPLKPKGDPEVLVNLSPGLSVVRQQYDGGYIYEYRVRPEIDPIVGPWAAAFTGETTAFEDERSHYVSAWVAEQESARLDSLAEGTRSQFDHRADPVGQPETLHQDVHVGVTRVRYPAGWLYAVTMKLGSPWPSFFLVPSLKVTRAAPIVSVESLTDERFITKFWVADTQPAAPAAA